MHMIYLIFFNDTAATEIYTLSLHDALPIYAESLPETLATTVEDLRMSDGVIRNHYLPEVHDALEESDQQRDQGRSEEHTSELQSRQYLVCRLLLEKNKVTAQAESQDPRMNR